MRTQDVGHLAWDPDGEKLKAYMEYTGVDSCIHVPLDWELGYGQSPDWTIDQITEHACELQKKLPAGKYFTCVGIDPRRFNAPEIVEKAVKEGGAVGIKLFPVTGFYPDDACCYRLYEKCANLGIPITIHSGIGDMGAAEKYSDPTRIDKAAIDFPEIDFVLAHAGGLGFGGGRYWEAIGTFMFRPNVYFELSAWDLVVIGEGNYPSHIPQFLELLEVTRRNLWPYSRTGRGFSRIIYGTDFIPSGKPPDRLKKWADLFKNLETVAAENGHDFSPEECELMRSGNAKRIWKKAKFE